jgi:hypothetical protein
MAASGRSHGSSQEGAGRMSFITLSIRLFGVIMITTYAVGV